MNEFPPARQRGLILHIGLAIGISLVSILAFYLTFHTPVGLFFTLYVLVFVVTAISIPILGYRAYALTRANYLIDRNTLRLIWGLRLEDIPVNEVEWIRPVKGLLAPLNLPWFRLPGGILGVTRQLDIGKVEFLASDTDNLVLVATASLIYAISPKNPAAFMAAFQKSIEMGSLNTLRGQSQYPSFMVTMAWQEPIVRFLWLVGAFLNAGLLVWVTVLIPSLAKVSLGFDANGIPLEAVPGTQLILLPILSSFLFAFGLLTGLFFYRKPELSILALTLWVSGVLSSLFFLIAVFFILNTPI
ncbi:MAG: PH domain-containing protein [Chloroflexota bacterium]